jgi:hypothetical protein
MGIELLAPYSSKKKDPSPKRSAFLSRLRYRIDTVFQPTCGALLCKAGVGARHVASDEPATEEGAESYLGLLAQLSGGQPTSSTGKAPPLKPAHRVS